MLPCRIIPPRNKRYAEHEVEIEGGGTAQIEGRLIAAGPHAGSYAVPERVVDDPVHAEKADYLRRWPLVDLDTDEAWPPEEA